MKLNLRACALGPLRENHIWCMNGNGPSMKMGFVNG